MDFLIAVGTSAAYFASILEMALAWAATTRADAELAAAIAMEEATERAVAAALRHGALGHRALMETMGGGDVDPAVA
jgi:hypothetical protein